MAGNNHDGNQLKDWPEEVVRAIIELVSQNEMLFNPRSPNYKKTKLKGKVWEEIAKSIIEMFGQMSPNCNFTGSKLICNRPKTRFLCYKC